MEHGLRHIHMIAVTVLFVTWFPRFIVGSLRRHKKMLQHRHDHNADAGNVRRDLLAKCSTGAGGGGSFSFLQSEKEKKNLFLKSLSFAFFFFVKSMCLKVAKIHFYETQS